MGQNTHRKKVIGASLILICAMVYWIATGVKNTSIRHFSPDQLILNATSVDQKGIQIDGVICEGSSRWKASELELTFAVRDLQDTAQVKVISTGMVRPDNFHDGGNVFVEGIYDADKNLIRATKVQTKCASKYENAEPDNSSKRAQTGKEI